MNSVGFVAAVSHSCIITSGVKNKSGCLAVYRHALKGFLYAQKCLEANDWIMLFLFESEFLGKKTTQCFLLSKQCWCHSGYGVESGWEQPSASVCVSEWEQAKTKREACPPLSYDVIRMVLQQWPLCVSVSVSVCVHVWMCVWTWVGGSMRRRRKQSH